ncbi:unnamed protein product [Trichobilharzia szidati]|nr:unnamed protein product [Trichobilharzia szidati]
MNGKTRSCIEKYSFPFLQKRSGILCKHLVECSNPFIAFDHIKVQRNESTSLHSHIGVQLITYLVDGVFKTPVSSWNSPTLEFTKFESECRHMETFVSDVNHSSAELFKVWIHCKPSVSMDYSHHGSQLYTSDDFTVVREEDNSAELRILSGSVSGVSGPIETDPPICFFDLYLQHSSSQCTTYCLPLSEEYETAFVYIWNSSDRKNSVLSIVSDVPNESTSLAMHEIAVLNCVGNLVKIKLHNNANFCRVIILAGRRIELPKSSSFAENAFDTIITKLLPAIPRIFSGLSLVGIVFGLYHYLCGTRSPFFVQYSLLYGKVKPAYCEAFESLRVPKRWFKYFYVTGVCFTCCALLIELFVISSHKTIVCVLTLYLIHVSRRLYECTHVSIFSNSLMSFMQFLVGIAFYIAAPIGISLSRSHAVERSNLVIVLFSLHILILQFLQDLVLQQLAALRTNKNENTEKVIEKKYYPPEGSMFHWVSCPHYLLEISLYLSWQVFLTSKWIPFSHILFFTTFSQLFSIWANHNWLKKNFPEWTSKRAMLIPYVL